MSFWGYSYGGWGGRSSMSGADSSDSDDEPTSSDLQLKRRAVEGDSASAAASTASATSTTDSSSARARLSQALDGDGDAANTSPSSAADAFAADMASEGDVLDASTYLREEDMNAAAIAAAEHMCEECGDQPASLSCAVCLDRFCQVCFRALHKSGNRRKHTSTPYDNPLTRDASGVPSSASSSSSSSSSTAAAAAESSSSSTSSSSSASSTSSADAEMDEDARPHPTSSSSVASTASSAATAPSGRPTLDANGVPTNLLPQSALSAVLPALSGDWFVERSRYIPMRLTMEERKVLRLVEASLNVSEYTDKIDIISSKDKAKRIHEQLRDICSILSGLVVANDYKMGQELIRDKDFEQNEVFFQTVFEIGRRHKIRNPEKMRSSYGKLLYLLQDGQREEIQDMLGFSLVRPIRTVFSELVAKHAIALLYDPRLVLATSEIKPAGKPRWQIDQELRAKEGALNYLARRYANDQLSEDDVKQLVLSIGDNHTYLVQNRNPCDAMLGYLQRFFRPDAYDPGFSLAIVGGRGGSRLTHSHSQQYAYASQSLILWRNILNEMFKLWICAEDDLLDPANQYRLRNTGQGLNRVQPCPRVSRLMHNILSECHRALGSWVGSSVIHLGDHNVPNAFMFIDKYNQVSRILNPIVLTLRAIDTMATKPELNRFLVQMFGGAEATQRLILVDFFRHAFDGSGSDNFFDAGSCIDGRLTSAWNWCSLLEKKPYYPVFQLAGFHSFDGEFV